MKAPMLLSVAAVAAILAVMTNVIVSNDSKVDTIPIEIHEAYAKFQAKYNKFPNTSEESVYRLGVFRTNVDRINAVNNGKFSYKAAINKFADLTREEFRAKHLGIAFSREEKNFIKAPTNKAIPSNVDLRTKGQVNPIVDQARCGSCWAFSAVAAMESSYVVFGGPLVKFSEQQLVDCSFKQGNHGCGGGWMERAYKYLLKTGIELNKNYPYIADVQKCQYNPNLVEADLLQYYNITPNSQSQLIVFAAQTTIATAVDFQGLDNYDSGVFDGYCTDDLNHGVNIIGYGTTKYGTDYWLGRNSFGSDWGEDGYFRIKRYMEDGPGWCGLAVSPSIVDVEKHTKKSN